MPSFEEVFAECRKAIGTETPRSASRYPAEHESIRRYCHMVEDDNPLFLDPGYAAEHRYGAIVCPPFYTGVAGGWPPSSNLQGANINARVPTPGQRSIVIGNELEVLGPVRVGDRLTTYGRIADVIRRPIRIDPEALAIVSETVTENQYGQAIRNGRSTVVRHRTPEEIAKLPEPPKFPDGPRAEPPSYNYEPIDKIPAATREQRYWDDVKEGDVVPGFELLLTETRIVLAVSGSQDFNPLHHDREHATQAGHADIFVNTGFTTACLGRLLSTYAGEWGNVKKLALEMRKQNRPGDLIGLTGRVVRTYQENGENLVDLAVWLQNQREGITSPCTATVALPLRGRWPLV